MHKGFSAGTVENVEPTETCDKAGETSLLVLAYEELELGGFGLKEAESSCGEGMVGGVEYAYFVFRWSSFVRVWSCPSGHMILK